MKPTLTDMNCRLWNKDAGVMISKTIDGELVRLTAESAAVDLYVCGFMCTPFTPNGLRKAWQDEHANTCWSSLKTISLLRHRAFLLEDVMAIANNSNSVVVRSALSKLSRYVVLHLEMNSTHLVCHITVFASMLLASVQTRSSLVSWNSQPRPWRHSSRRRLQPWVGRTRAPISSTG